MTRSVWDGFDPDDSFVVARPIRLSGEVILAGTPFDKSRVRVVTLRAMWNAGELKRGTGQPAAAKPLRHVQHIGRGRWAVMEGANRLTPDPLTKEQAEAELARLGG